MVLFNMRVNPIGWPLAIVSSMSYGVFFWHHKLYGDASLQVFFIVIAVWGWAQWLRDVAIPDAPLRVRSMTKRQRATAWLAMAVAWPATGLFLKTFTDTDVPWWDAFPTAASVLGQVLLGRKFIENWAVWLVVNVVGTTLFAYKGLWLTALLYAVFAAMSVSGLRAWRRLSMTRSGS